MEPTLSMPYFNEHFEDWIKAFPNLTKIEYSTNGMANVEAVIELAKNIDKYVDHEINYNVQFSYDGEYSTNNIRHANDQTIKNNIIKFMDYMNEHGEFRHMKIELSFHGVTSFAMIKQLDTPEKIHDYFKEVDTFAYGFVNYNTNPSVRVFRRVSMNIESPYDGSTTDGATLANFIHMCQAIDWSDMNTPDPETYGMDTIGIVAMVREALCSSGRLNRSPSDTYQSYAQVLEDFLNNPEQIPSILQNMNYCGNNRSELKIMWDGTLVNCQNHMFELHPEDLVNDGSVTSQAKIERAKQGYFLNPLTASDEEIDKNLSLFKKCNQNGFIFTYNEVLNLMYLLAKSKQIDSSYLYDKDKCMRHAFILTMIFACSYNNIIKTGSTLLRTTGYIRTYCNGAIDLIEKRMMEQDIKHQREEERMNGGC